jgi:hypothetical protein
MDEQEPAVGMSETRRLAEEGRCSGISSEDGEDFLDRMEERYLRMMKRADG